MQAAGQSTTAAAKTPSAKAAGADKAAKADQDKGPGTTAASTTETAAAAPVAERKIQQVDEIRVKPAEFARNVWVMVAHASNEPADLARPDYWAHVSHKLKRHDHLEIWADNGTWYAHMLVLDSGRGFARVHQLELVDLNLAIDGGQTIKKGGYEILYRGEHHKWSVVRLSDKEVVSEGHGTQGPAVDWLEERLKADR